jgi:hypothetical protein
MTPDQRLDLAISRKGMTRITVENDGIEDLYVFPSNYGENIQKSPNGHLFVVGEGVDDPISITIITKRNIAQDLRLIPRSQKAEPIILTYTDPESYKKETQKRMSQFLKIFLQGSVPSGFFKGTIREASRSRGTVEAVAVCSYRNPEYVVTKFTVKNQGPEKVILNPSNLWSEDDLAVVFNVESLEPSIRGDSDEAKMFVIRRA